MNEKFDAARGRISEMEKAGGTYFTGRTQSIKDIQDPALREQAQQRLSQNQEKHVQVMSSLQEAGRSLDPVRKECDAAIEIPTAWLEGARRHDALQASDLSGFSIVRDDIPS
jgi:Protein of unknown function (DUF2959)